MNLDYGCSMYMLVSSSVSIVSSVSIIADIYFKNQGRKTTSMYGEIVINLALGCLVTACGSIVGEVRNGSPECWYMGLTTNIGSLAAMFWTAYLTYYLNKVSKSSEVMQNSKLKNVKTTLTAYLVCWGVPIFVTLFPLIFFSIGALWEYGWCFWVDRGVQTPWLLFSMWWLSYYLWIYISLLLAFYYIGSSSYYLHKASTSQQSLATVDKALFRLRLYSVCILASWLPYTIYDVLLFVISTPTNDNEPSLCIMAICACSQGFFTACVYWGTSVTSSKVTCESSSKHATFEHNSATNRLSNKLSDTSMSASVNATTPTTSSPAAITVTTKTSTYVTPFEIPDDV